MLTRLRHVVEVGAGDSHSSEGLSWATHADKVSLYEAHPLLWADLHSAAAGLPNVTVHHAAVYDPAFKCPLYLMGYASYLQGTPSFLATSIERDGEKWWIPLTRDVPFVSVGDAIPLDTEGLILTCNGAETLILQQMQARPKVVWTKHYTHNARQWEEARQVFAALERLGYRGTVIASVPFGTYHHVEWRRG